MVVEPNLQDDSEFLYAAQPDLLQYRTPQLTVEKVMAWYQRRAEAIEHHAGQVRAGSTAAQAGVVPALQDPGLLVHMKAVPGISGGMCKRERNIP